MALLNASLRTELRNVLVALPRPVTLLVFVGAACDPPSGLITQGAVPEAMLMAELIPILEAHAPPAA